MPDDDRPELGPCCICGISHDIVSIALLPFKCQVPGHGWGCAVCRLPADGAIAVVCAMCTPAFDRGATSLRFACRGYAATDGRVPIEALTEPHDHTPALEH